MSLLFGTVRTTTCSWGKDFVQGEELPQLFNNFDVLVAQPWTSRRELLGLVYGFNLDSLRPDTSFEVRQLSRQAASNDQFIVSGSSQPSQPRLAPFP